MARDLLCRDGFFQAQFLSSSMQPDPVPSRVTWRSARLRFFSAWRRCACRLLLGRASVDFREVDSVYAFHSGVSRPLFDVRAALAQPRSVLNLQHTDSFDRENPWKHKNAAVDYGFCLPVFLKMALVLVRRTSRDLQRGLEVADGELGAQ
jgi:hypothetical protein